MLTSCWEQVSSAAKVAMVILKVSKHCGIRKSEINPKTTGNLTNLDPEYESIGSVDV